MSFENFKKKDTPLVWAHRGASGYAPENTIESFGMAIEQAPAFLRKMSTIM